MMQSHVRIKRLTVLSFVLVNIMAILGACLLLSFLVNDPPYDYDYLLQQYANQIYTYPLPPGTEVVERRADFKSHHYGEGRYFREFLVEQTMVSELSQQEINAYYEKIRYPDTRGQERIKANIEFIDILNTSSTTFNIKVRVVISIPGE